MSKYEWHDRQDHTISPNESNWLYKLARDCQRTNYNPYNEQVLKCLKTPFARDVALALIGEIPKKDWSRTLHSVVNELINRYKIFPAQTLDSKRKVVKFIREMPVKGEK